MIGQDKLQAQLLQYNLDTIPKTLLFVGPEGCGKHSLTAKMAQKLLADIIEVSENVDSDILIDFQQQPIPTFYLIDLDKFTERQQNQFLKFIEEPGKNVFVILLSSTAIGVLPTILNRCQTYYFEPYTVAQLQQVREVSNSILYKICNTPGQLLQVDVTRFDELVNLCNYFLTTFTSKPTANILSIVNLLNFEENYDKFDYSLFLRTLIFLAGERYLQEQDELSKAIYIKTVAYYTRLQFKTLNKETFMINYLLYLKENIN